MHTNETLHPISRACVLGVTQKCRHTWNGGEGGGGGLLITVTYIVIR